MISSMTAVVAIVTGIVLTIIIIVSCIIIFHRKRTSLNLSIYTYGVIRHILFLFSIIRRTYFSHVKINKYVDISKILLSYCYVSDELIKVTTTSDLCHISDDEICQHYM